MHVDLNNKKRRHHYVWQHYLRAWAWDGLVSCRRPDGSTFRTATGNLGVIKDFYRLKDISHDDVQFVDAISIQRAPAAIQQILRAWIPMFTGVVEIKKAMKQAGFRADAPQSAKLLDTAANNLEEDLHSFIEGNAIPHIDALHSGKTDFLSNQGEITSFLHYICVQFMRTRNRRERMFAAFRDVDLGRVNLEAAWGLMSHVLATTIAYNLYARTDEMVFTMIESPSKHLITADQPVINLYAVGAPERSEVERFAFYYPVSPTRALMIETDQPNRLVQARTATQEQAAEYNAAMLDQSYEQAYALAAEDFG
jgi:hypothetical protein